MKRFPLLLIVVLMASVVLNLFVLLGMSRYKQKVDRQFEITNVQFNHAVFVAVSNYLSSIRPTTLQTNQVKPTVEARPINATIYPDYFRRQWVLYSEGVRYRQGDYFADSIIESICEDRVYCRNGNKIVIFRPSPMRDVASGGARAAKAESQSEDAPL